MEQLLAYMVALTNT